MKRMGEKRDRYKLQSIDPPIITMTNRRCANYDLETVRLDETGERKDTKVMTSCKTSETFIKYYMGQGSDRCTRGAFCKGGKGKDMGNAAGNLRSEINHTWAVF